MSFYPAKGGGKEKEIQVLTLQNAGFTYYQVGQGSRSKYTFTKAYKNAIVLFSKSKNGGDIAFAGCNYEVSKSYGTTVSYKLTNIQSGATISCYTYNNESVDNVLVLAVFAQE